MKKIRFCVDQVVYKNIPNHRYIKINGWILSTEDDTVQVFSVLNGKQIYHKRFAVERPDVQKKFKRKNVRLKSGFDIQVDLEETVPEEYILYVKKNGVTQKLYTLDRNDFEEIEDRKSLTLNIDGIYIDKAHIVVNGWSVSQTDRDIEYKVTDNLGNDVETSLELRKRQDLYKLRLTDKKHILCGFKATFLYEEDKEYTLKVSDTVDEKTVDLVPEELWKAHRYEARKGFLFQALKKAKVKNLIKVYRYIAENGLKGLGNYLVERINSNVKHYDEWFKENQLTEKEIEAQKNKKFDYEPKISIVVPTYNTPLKFLKEMVESLENQTYSNWELCIGDGSEGNQELEEALKAYQEKDKRIKYKILPKNMGISGNTNGALELATGEYVGLLDHDDALAINALYEVVNALQETDYDVIYTDEDMTSYDMKVHKDPKFKPDFSMDLLCSHNYITHFFVVKTEIIKKIGGFRSEFDGSQDYDLIFRCVEEAKQIKHIPKILYYWRMHENSVAGNPASKMYAYEAGKRAIEEHFKRTGVSAKVEHTELWGMYHVIYDTPGDPLVSIIIPNKDHIEDLEKCVSSIQEKSSYRNIEFIIVENNSEKEKTFAYYEELEKRYDNVKVVYWKKEFNYSAINNFGVQYANGDYLLFLNNDTEIINDTAISEMLGCCMREDVGIVGAKLLYEDDTIQHAGVVIGIGGFAGHVFVGLDKDDYGYMVRPRINCNYSAVTAACMMTSKEDFLSVGGFTEEFAVALNDVDYCLKIREKGKWVVYNAFSLWHHYESKSRGYEDTPEKIRRFENEISKFQKRWKTLLEEGDPFYNPNFSLEKEPFNL